MPASAPLGCDAAQALAARTARPAVRPRLALATSILASSLAFIDGSVVNVGLRAIERSLHASPAELQWTINAYLLPLTALLLLGGALGDRYGRGRWLTLGVALFAAASAACAAAPNVASLLAARALQGVGAALVLPNSLAILGAAFDGTARARAVGLWAAASSVAAAIGPVIGGWLIDVSGWRAIFLINLPLAVATIGLAFLAVRDPPPERGEAPLDFAGALLGAAMVAAAGATAYLSLPKPSRTSRQGHGRPSPP